MTLPFQAYLKREAEQILNTKQIGEVTRDIKHNAKKALLPEYSLSAEDFKRPANYAEFQKAKQKHGAGFEEQKDNYTNFVVMAYVGFIGAMISLMVIAMSSFIATFGAIGIFLFMTSLWFRGSYWAFLLNHQHLDGFMEWAVRPSEWLPSPSFEPDQNEKGGV